MLLLSVIDLKTWAKLLTFVVAVSKYQFASTVYYKCQQPNVHGTTVILDF